MVERKHIIMILGLTSCSPQRDAILNKDPFEEVVVETPDDGANGVIHRSDVFAAQNGFEIQHSIEHFTKGEYSVLLLRKDMNIAAENVIRGNKSIVRAYSVRQPSKNQKAAVSDYLCSVMKAHCGQPQAKPTL